MRSLTVVLPASMCATTPKLRTRERFGGIGAPAAPQDIHDTPERRPWRPPPPMSGRAARRPSVTYRGVRLPGEVRERLVRFSLLVRVLALQDRAALLVEGGHELLGERLVRRLALAAAHGLEDPPVGEGALAPPAHL